MLQQNYSIYRSFEICEIYQIYEKRCQKLTVFSIQELYPYIAHWCSWNLQSLIRYDIVDISWVCISRREHDHLVIKRGSGYYKLFIDDKMINCTWLYRQILQYYSVRKYFRDSTSKDFVSCSKMPSIIQCKYQNHNYQPSIIRYRFSTISAGMITRCSVIVIRHNPCQLLEQDNVPH